MCLGTGAGFHLLHSLLRSKCSQSMKHIPQIIHMCFLCLPWLVHMRISGDGDCDTLWRELVWVEDAEDTEIKVVFSFLWGRECQTSQIWDLRVWLPSLYYVIHPFTKMSYEFEKNWYLWMYKKEIWNWQNWRRSKKSWNSWKLIIFSYNVLL